MEIATAERSLGIEASLCLLLRVWLYRRHGIRRDT